MGHLMDAVAIAIFTVILGAWALVGGGSTQPTLRLQKSTEHLFSDLVERQSDGSPVAHAFLLAVRLLPTFTSDFTP
jgi:hypothetical protein